GPIWVEGSRPSPTLSAAARATKASTNALCTDSWTTTRLAAVQRCPDVPNPPQRAPSTANSRSASSITMMTFLPPISRWTFLNPGAQAWLTSRPVSVDPVNETTRTSGCATSGAPVPGPSPKTRFSTTAGTPASASACTKLTPDAGASSAGLNTTVLPHTRAGRIFHDGTAIGKFQAVIIPQTPIGWRIDIANLSRSSDGTVWPNM